MTDSVVFDLTKVRMEFPSTEMRQLSGTGVGMGNQDLSLMLLDLFPPLPDPCIDSQVSD